MAAMEDPAQQAARDRQAYKALQAWPAHKARPENAVLSETMPSTALAPTVVAVHVKTFLKCVSSLLPTAIGTVTGGTATGQQGYP